MRHSRVVTIAVLVAALNACTCAETAKTQRYACTSTLDCAAGNICRGGECRSENIPPGQCFPGDPPKACTIQGCAQPCGADGGFQACVPTAGGGFSTNPQHCGECGRSCSQRLGDALTCIDAFCTCSADPDCPLGEVCAAGGVCVLETAPCAKIRCPTGEVCRGDVCTPVPCDPGCNPGEVCDQTTTRCRPIDRCHFPAACGPDGGICEGPAKADGELCNDGAACTFGDVCNGGLCSGTAYSCPTPNACQQSVACAGDGGCDAVALPDGTVCDDGVTCTHSDVCVSGQCAGTTYVCTPTQCAATSVCAGDGGCDVTPRNIGAACDDAVACSFNDVCGDAGVCVGTAYTCPTPTTCQMTVACAGDGGCVVTDKPNGSACDDSSGCTTLDTCTGGTCVGGAPATSYQDIDGDGRGNSNITQAVCPLPAGFVLVGGDCNDGDPDVFLLQPSVQDVDQDGVTDSVTLNPTACVGASTTISGRTYYKDVNGAYTWLAAASASIDCNDANPLVFSSRPTMVTDTDHDGYYTGASATVCVGASLVFNGRTYYANTAGAYVYLDAASALGSADCLDSDPDVYRNVASLYTDQDLDGYTLGAAGTQCVGASSTSSGRTYYTNSAGVAFYGVTSLGTDCNDTNPGVTGPTNYYVDGDGDGVGAGAPTARCAPLAGEVVSGTDCNDANNLISVTRNAYTDVDHDGYAAAPGTVQNGICSGPSSTFNGRTYFRDAAGGYTWVLASLGLDCDDAVATTLGAPTWYADTDSDTFGNLLSTVVACAQPGGYVANSTDCNDTTANAYRTIGSLYTDTDQDGYSTGVTASQCVGTTTPIGGRTYYRSAAGTFIYTPTSLGTDCNTANGAIFSFTPELVVVDKDQDGYPVDNLQTMPCAGALTTFNGRAYYPNGSGGFYLRVSNCINVNGGGTQCQSPYDVDDNNAAVH